MSRKLATHRRKSIHPGPMSKSKKQRRNDQQRSNKRKRFTMRECELQFPGTTKNSKDLRPAKRLYGKRLGRFGVYEEVTKQR